LFVFTAWVTRHSANILAEMLRVAVKGIGIVFFFFVEGGWLALSLGWGKVIRPLASIARKPFLIVWRSPWWSLWLSGGALLFAWFHHQGLFDLHLAWFWTGLGTFVSAPSRLARAAIDIASNIVMAAAPRCNLVSTSVLSQARALSSSLAVVERSSPSLALLVWAATTVLSKLQQRVRVKTLALPLTAFHISVYGGFRLLPWIGLSVIWVLFGKLFVDRREDRANRLIDEWQRRYSLLRRAHVDAMQRRRQSQPPERQEQTDIQGEQIGDGIGLRQRLRPSAPPMVTAPSATPLEPPDKTQDFDQVDCPMCFESIAEGTATAHVMALPCGHRFCQNCITEWLRRTNHCPMCRQAAGGVERLIEIVF